MVLISLNSLRRISFSLNHYKGFTNIMAMICRSNAQLAVGNICISVLLPKKYNIGLFIFSGETSKDTGLRTDLIQSLISIPISGTIYNFLRSASSLKFIPLDQ